MGQLGHRDLQDQQDNKDNKGKPEELDKRDKQAIQEVRGRLVRRDPLGHLGQQELLEVPVREVEQEVQEHLVQLEVQVKRASLEF